MLRLILALDDSIRPPQTTGERRVEAFIHEFAISYFNSERDSPTNLCPDYVPCAVERHRPSAGANPARQTVAPAGSNRSG